MISEFRSFCNIYWLKKQLTWANRNEKLARIIWERTFWTDSYWHGVILFERNRAIELSNELNITELYKRNIFAN